MKSLRNTVHLIGRLGNDPEINEFTTGNRKAILSLATTESYLSKEGKKVENTQWHRLVVWGPKVKTVEQYLKKGMEIGVDGSLSYLNWEDKEGKKHSLTEILVNELVMLEKRK
jgi:single-strand DNA-binding protein